MFFLNWENGVNYNMVAQTPQYDVQSLRDLQNIPITGAHAARPEILADVASITRSDEMAVVSHYNVARVVDIFGAVQDRSGRGRRPGREDRRPEPLACCRAAALHDDPRTAANDADFYVSLLGGLLFSIVLVYLLIVVTFQSWLDPFIIITALPAALAGIVLFLFFTHTALSVPALMGAIMCMGVATSNSILVVAFAKERLAATGDPIRAAMEAGFTAPAPGSDDGPCHGDRHGADGAGPWRRRRAERTTWPRRNRWICCWPRSPQSCSSLACLPLLHGRRADSASTRQGGAMNPFPISRVLP